MKHIVSMERTGKRLVESRSGSVILSGSKSTLKIPLLIVVFKFSSAAVSEIPRIS